MDGKIQKSDFRIFFLFTLRPSSFHLKLLLLLLLIFILQSSLRECWMPAEQITSEKKKKKDENLKILHRAAPSSLQFSSVLNFANESTSTLKLEQEKRGKEREKKTLEKSCNVNLNEFQTEWILQFFFYDATFTLRFVFRVLIAEKCTTAFLH